MRTTQARPVLDGRSVKWTLERAQAEDPGLVRIDWLRFTLPLETVVQRAPHLNQDLTYFDLLDQSGRDVARMARCADRGDGATSAQAVARAGAHWFCSLMGSPFEVGPIDEKGMDYYTARTPLMVEGAVVGFCLAGGKSTNQASTVHFNLFGSACLHIGSSQWARVKPAIDSGFGWITRVDLALDVFEGFDIEQTRTAYLSAMFDVRGKRPGQREIGSWTLGHSRTFEVGSRATGKVCRTYEKGHEQFGAESTDPWVRVEVEFRANHRVIESEVLTCPGDFFAGAYPYCQRLMEQRKAVHISRRIPTNSEVADKTADAAATRVVRWVGRTAAPALAYLLSHGGDLLETIIDREAYRMPKRFVGFGTAEVRAALKRLAETMAPVSAPSMAGA